MIVCVQYWYVRGRNKVGKTVLRKPFKTIERNRRHNIWEPVVIWKIKSK